MVQGKVLAFLALQIVLVTCNSGQMTTEGEDCVFPFIYKGKEYNSCTTKNHNRPWCSTTRNYDKEKQWGNCEGFSSSGTWTTLFRPIFWGGSESWEYCVFPFIYKGVTYKSCTTEKHDRPWCSTTYKYERKWGNCAGFSSSGVKTTSDEYCAFPFTYHGEEYHSCITKNHNRPWCSTTTKYDKDLKRGDCKGFYSSGVRTTSGEYCAFPFYYRGQRYNSCTRKNHNRPWCALTTNYHKDRRKWGNCA